MPSNVVINRASDFTGKTLGVKTKDSDNGWTPSILMDRADHKRTNSYQRSKAAMKFQDKQVDLIRAGKIMEAMKMDVDDINGIKKGKLLGHKYDKELRKAVYNMYTLLKMNDEEFAKKLPGYTMTGVLIKSRKNPDNIALAENLLKEMSEPANKKQA
jgi:hypothetical protein